MLTRVSYRNVGSLMVDYGDMERAIRQADEALADSLTEHAARTGTIATPTLGMVQVADDVGLTEPRENMAGIRDKLRRMLDSIL